MGQYGPSSGGNGGNLSALGNEESVACGSHKGRTGSNPTLTATDFKAFTRKPSKSGAKWANMT
jgi:hypothetical protein